MFIFGVTFVVEKIRRLCNVQGKTLASLEKECGLGSGTINKWDKSSPSVNKVVAVAAVLGVPVVSLIEDEISEGSSPQFIRRTELLLRRGISFSDLSKKTGISVYRLRHYFSEDTLGGTDFLHEYPKLARALGVSPQYLHCLTDHENDESDTDERFCDWVVGNPSAYTNYAKKEKPTPVSEDGPALDKSLVERLVQLSPEEQKMVEAFVQGMIAERSTNGT